MRNLFLFILLAISAHLSAQSFSFACETEVSTDTLIISSSAGPQQYLHYYQTTENSNFYIDHFRDTEQNHLITLSYNRSDSLFSHGAYENKKEGVKYSGIGKGVDATVDGVMAYISCQYWGWFLSTQIDGFNRPDCEDIDVNLSTDVDITVNINGNDFSGPSAGKGAAPENGLVVTLTGTAADDFREAMMNHSDYIHVTTDGATRTFEYNAESDVWFLQLDVFTNDEGNRYYKVEAAIWIVDDNGNRTLFYQDDISENDGYNREEAMMIITDIFG